MEHVVCASISTNSTSFHKNVMFTSWRYCNERRHEICISKTSLGRNIFGFLNSKSELVTRHWVLRTASENLSPETKLNCEELEPKINLNPVAEGNDSNESSSYASERSLGKSGFISFHGIPSQRQEEQVLQTSSSKDVSKLLWFIGPIILVTFLVFPSLYLRRILSVVFEDSLLTDFLILFFTEALFYGGVAIFLFIVDHIWRPLLQNAPSNKYYSNFKFGIQISSIATLVLTLIIPLVTMGMVWPWTGPAASAALAPYLVGLIVQFAFERYAWFSKSPAWPVIPIIFQVYRLHQLNRAAQLVTALSYSLRGAETTLQTVAINRSLGTLLTVLQILGVICIWSLSSFLMRFIPSFQVIS